MRWSEVLAFLERRRGLLDGVVFSGGKPTLQAVLPEAPRRALGFETALHTGGMYPARLAIKAPAQRYPAITGADGGAERVARSLDLLLASGVAPNAAPRACSARRNCGNWAPASSGTADGSSRSRPVGRRFAVAGRAQCRLLPRNAVTSHRPTAGRRWSIPARAVCCG